MSKTELGFIPLGRQAILIKWPEKIDENQLFDILDHVDYLRELYIKQKVYINHTYNSILVSYNITIENINSKILELKHQISEVKSSKSRSVKRWLIPTCYIPEFGIDLESISRQKNLTVNDIINLHSGTDYRVYFLGFLPGFLYLGGLDEKLHIDRKSTPRLNIQKGAVAIGGKQTGIYPQESPGGWNIIGNTPLNLFDRKSDPPCYISAGDLVRFKPVTKSEYLQLNDRIEKGSYKPQFEMIS